MYTYTISYALKLINAKYNSIAKNKILFTGTGCCRVYIISDTWYNH